MHENQGVAVIFYAFYTQDGAGDAGLTVTVDVYEVIRDGTATLIVDDGATTEIGGGLYRYLLAAASVDAAAEYVAIFHTADTDTDQKDLPAMWVIDRAGTEKLDSEIATILADTNELQTDWVNGGRLDLILDSISATTGAGASANTFTVQDGSGNPLPNAHVWATTDLAGTTTVASALSNALGRVTFYLDAGVTYYIWKQKEGYDFTNPDTEVAV